MLYSIPSHRRFGNKYFRYRAWKRQGDNGKVKYYYNSVFNNAK